MYKIREFIKLLKLQLKFILLLRILKQFYYSHFCLKKPAFALECYTERDEKVGNMTCDESMGFKTCITLTFKTSSSKSKARGCGSDMERCNMWCFSDPKCEVI